MPVIKLRLGGHSDSSKDFNFLLDTGSERSYLAQEAASTITINPKMVSIVDYRVKTFTGSGYKTLKEVNLGIYPSPNSKEPVFTQMLIDDNFDLNVRAPNLCLAMENIRKAGFN